MTTPYKTFRVAILGSLPDTGSVSIASQMSWVNVLLEIVEEGLLQPLYHCLGATVGDAVQASKSNSVDIGYRGLL